MTERGKGMKDIGFIILHRSLLEWEWYNDVNTTRLFIHCLLKANYKTKQWRGITIDRGTFLTSTKSLVKETGLTTRQIRTSLLKLVMTGELTIKPTTKNTTITVNNYDAYQSNDKQNDNQTTSKKTIERQTNDKPATTTKQSNKVTKKQVIKRVQYGEFVKLTQPQYQKLIEDFDATTVEAIINRMNEYIGMKGTTYKDYNLAIRKWLREQTSNQPKWLNELKAEQEVADNKTYEVKRTAQEAKDILDKL